MSEGPPVHGAPSAVRRWVVAAVLTLASLGASGCATRAAARFSPGAVAAMSPAAEVVRPLDAMRLGSGYVALHPGTAYLVGSGDSMRPLYRDNTVVVTRRIPTRDLRAGMTVVYMGSSGRPVAHVLVRQTWDGWVAQGVGNEACDTVKVTGQNLVGVVVRAFEPSRSPLLALALEGVPRTTVASLP
jgi:hypothetical protein